MNKFIKCIFEIWYTMISARIIFTFFLSISGYCMISCNEAVNCAATSNDFINVDFKNKSDGDFSEVSFDFITALNSQAIFFDAQDTLASFNLPIDPDSTITTFIFNKAGITDTLAVSYKIQASIISEDCGPEIIFSDLDTLSTTFDSLKIVDRRLLKDIIKNIEIFR